MISNIQNSLDPHTIQTPHAPDDSVNKTWGNLPLELYQNIFQYMVASDIEQFLLVSKNYNQIIKADSIVCALYSRPAMYLSPDEKTSVKNWDTYVIHKSHDWSLVKHLESNDGPQRYLSLVSRIQRRQLGWGKYIPLNPPDQGTVRVWHLLKYISMDCKIDINNLRFFAPSPNIASKDADLYELLKLTGTDTIHIMGIPLDNKGIFIRDRF